ncbi:MAG: hypothetical protein ABSG91_12050 [Syntrophobacteraceae bacterium]|jgi:hypothetical protein
MEKKEFEGKESRELEQAEALLKKAESDLEKARTAEEAAEHEIDEALQEIKEAEAHHDHEIHFTVDGEPDETTRREMTPDEIISEFGGKDPAINYLVRIEGGHQQASYRDQGSVPIKLHNGMHFQIISLGPTPVSDGPIRSSIEVFVEGLKALGYSLAALPGKPDHAVIDYEVPTGRFAGKKVRLGFIVPADFPMTPPSGPHVSPRIHPITGGGGQHPTGGVSHSPSFEEGAGGEWQYWSRSFPDWAQSKKTAAAYMNHIYRLWDSQ